MKISSFFYAKKILKNLKKKIQTLLLQKWIQLKALKVVKVILTLHFNSCSFILAFIREHNDAQSVIDIFNQLEKTLGLDTFRKLFLVILTDNGSEFSNPHEIKFNSKGERRTKIFYCEPNRTDQKAHCENNHEFIRKVLPKKTSFDPKNLTFVTEFRQLILKGYKPRRLWRKI